MNKNAEDETTVIEEINGELVEFKGPYATLNAQRAKEGKVSMEQLMETHGDLDFDLTKTPEEWEKMEKEFEGYFPDLYKQYKGLFTKKRSETRSLSMLDSRVYSFLMN